MRYVYVVVSRSTGFVFGVTENIERARALLNEGQAAEPTSLISINQEPVLQ